MDDLIVPSTPAPTDTCDLPPFVRETVVLTKQDYIELTAQANYYKARHQRSLEREAQLKQQLACEQAKVRELTQRLYGKKSETHRKREQTHSNDSHTKPHPRGQQAGSKGHGRTQRPDLPVITEVRDLADNDKQCSCCGLPYKALNTEDSDIIEIEVRAYTRRIKRKQ